MESMLPFLLALAAIVAIAKAAGYAAVRLHQPAVLGELLAGFILGPTVLNMMGWPVFAGMHLEETMSYLAHVGVLFLMFIAGLEVDLEAMVQSGRAAVLTGVMGVIAPVLLGPIVALPFGYDLQHGIFIGLMLAATSVSISAQTLMELGVLRTRVGVVLLGAAIADDILVILFLSLFTALTLGGGNGPASMALVVLKMLLYLAVTLWVSRKVLPRTASLVDRLPISQGVMALVIVAILFYSWAAEALGGMAAITGAFLAGLAFARTPFRHSIEDGMNTLAYSWLVPVFFVSIGLEANARTLGWAGVPFALAIIVAAVVSKLVGCGVGARMGGCTANECLRLGVGMSSRGEVGLIVATVGLNAGIIGDNVFAAVLLMVLATTLMTPLMLRALYPKARVEPAHAPALGSTDASGSRAST